MAKKKKFRVSLTELTVFTYGCRLSAIKSKEKLRTTLLDFMQEKDSGLEGEARVCPESCEDSEGNAVELQMTIKADGDYIPRPSTEFIDFVIYYFYEGQVWTVSKLDSGEITDGKVFGGRTFIEPSDLGEDAQFDGGGVGSDIYLTFQIHDKAHDMEEVEISMGRDMDELVDHFYERLEACL